MNAGHDKSMTSIHPTYFNFAPATSNYFYGGLMIVPVVLAGGTGTRLWPLSRSAYPKQLLSLVSGQTMLQDTLLRIQSIPDIASPLVICNQEHRFLIAEQLHEIGIEAHIILEPVGKNTAPAATLAALFLKEHYHDDPLLMILPADHIIQDIPCFHRAIHDAEKNARDNLLVTFGVTPYQPETGYGYIKTATHANNQQGYPVLQFVEKPDLKTAQDYVASGQYYWNSGMFMFLASSFLSEVSEHASRILEVCHHALKEMTKDLDFSRLNSKIFSDCPNDSIDYAIMEKTKNAVLVPLNAKWSDVGSWQALWEVLPTDEQGNVIQGDIVVDQVTNSYLRAESRMMAVIGIKDQIVVETKDAVLIAHKDKCQSVKEIVNILKKNKRTETDLHRRVYRPWGHYEIVDQGDSFQVKRITVKPGATLSLQKHHHRSEHWVVVSGTAEVTRDNDIFTLTANESTYIPLGIKHRLANPGKINLEMIEVQSGRYLGEDDIVRFEDIYGRVE